MRLLTFLLKAAEKPETAEEKFVHEALEFVVYGSLFHTLKVAETLEDLKKKILEAV